MCLDCHFVESKVFISLFIKRNEINNRDPNLLKLIKQVFPHSLPYSLTGKEHVVALRRAASSEISVSNSTFSRGVCHLIPINHYVNKASNETQAFPKGTQYKAITNYFLRTTETLNFVRFRVHGVKINQLIYL